MNMKKISSLLLALVLVLAMAVPAFAAEGDKNNSITINNAKVGETYELYKLFDLKVNDENNPTAYTYTVNADWAAFFAEGGAGAQYVTINDAGAVTAISDAAALAKAAKDWADKPATAKQTVVATTETVVFENLENGYWLVTSTLGTIAMAETTPDQEKVTINEKNPEDTVDKLVKEDSTGDFGKSNDAQVGDTVEFESVITLQKGTRNVKVTDTMDSGLTYNKDAAIDGLTKGTDYTITETDNGFVISFKDTYLNSLTAETKLTLTYTATLNENAVVKGNDGVAIKDQNNKIVVSYGDNQQSVEATTTTTTHKFEVFKHATDSSANLAGAVFSLKKAGVVVKLIKLDDNNYRVANGDEAGAVDTFTTVANGNIVIWGVDSDNDYTLEEITAPTGYNELTAEVSVTVDADNSTVVDVENKSGTELPSTGGMGTTILYVAGGILVLGAVIVLITKKRMAASK